jgi:DNA-binding CsgD family transcriptional regulator
MLIDAVTSLLSVRNADELQQALLRHAAEFDFGLINAVLVTDHVGQPTEFQGVANWAKGYEGLALCRSKGESDPVMQHLKTSNRPIAWNRSTYACQGRELMWDQQAVFGYKAGISAVLHLPCGEHFVLGVMRDEPLPKDEARLADWVAQIHLLTVYAYEAGARVLRAPREPQFSNQLSQRERECLLWTAEGKTAWEIGRILSLSERTVAGQLSSAMRKLECVNKQQAVVKALRLGLLDLH